MSEKLFYDIMNEHYRYCEYCKHSSNTVCKPCMESDYRKNFELDKDYLFSIGEVIEICEDYRQIANMRDYMHSKDTAMYNKRIFDEIKEWRRNKR